MDVETLIHDLRVCSDEKVHCSDCSRNASNSPCKQLKRDAADCIEALVEQMKHLKVDLFLDGSCQTCKHKGADPEESPCNACEEVGDFAKWAWRGACEENTVSDDWTDVCLPGAGLE